MAAEELVAAVDEICGHEGADVVVPLADETLGLLLTRPPASARWAVMAPSVEAFEALANKANLAGTAARAGLDVAQQVTVAPGESLLEIPPLPAYVKVVSGITDGRPTGRPVRVTTELECKQAVAGRLDDGRSVIVQEEVRGERWRVHFARRGTTFFHVGVRTLADYPPRTGQSSISDFGPTPPRLAAAAAALLDVASCEGIGSIQLIVRDGRIYTHDVNLRIPASVAGTIAAGLDMAKVGIQIALGEPIHTSVRPRALRLVQLTGELPALVDAFRSRSAGRSSRNIAAQIVLAAALPGRRLEPLDLRDPLPTVAALSAAINR